MKSHFTYYSPMNGERESMATQRQEGVSHLASPAIETMPMVSGYAHAAQMH
jgi:hypothetical protein